MKKEEIVRALLAQQAENEKRRKRKEGVEAEPEAEEEELGEGIEECMERIAGSLRFFRGLEGDVLSLATHLAKGIHTGLKTNNAVCVGEEDGVYVTTASIPCPCIDAVSSASALHGGHLKNVLDLLNLRVGDERVWQALLKEGSAVEGVLAFMADMFGDADEAKKIADWLKEKMEKIARPAAGYRSKQLLFPVGGDHENYHVLIPLYPMSLANYVYRRVNEIRFGKDEEDRKLVRRSVPNLAMFVIGGSNSQNVSRLNNVQGGRHYVLPALPPEYEGKNRFRMKPDAKTFFDGRLYRMCQDEFQVLFSVVRETRNTIEIRDTRRLAIDNILDKVLYLAIGIQDGNPPGWSKTMKRLPLDEQLWLDPGRCELEGEEEFARWRDGDEWKKRIAQRFHEWTNAELQREFEEIDFDRAVPTQWRAAIRKLLDEEVIA